MSKSSKARNESEIYQEFCHPFFREIMFLGHDEDVSGPSRRIRRISSDEELDDEFGSNTNTLETMSAKSFGSFLRPSSQLREEDINKRLQRYQSFFNPEPPTYPQNGRNYNVRRAESFSHSGHEKPEISKRPDRDADQKSNLHKAKSMEFLKAKLLPKKAPRSPSVPKKNPTPDRSPSVASLCNKSDKKPAEYDWRQDTPFWNGGGRRGGAANGLKSSRSNNGSRNVEEMVGPWQNLHHPSPPPQMIPHFHPSGGVIPPPALMMARRPNFPMYPHPQPPPSFGAVGSFMHTAYPPQSLTHHHPVTAFHQNALKLHPRPYSAMSSVEKLSDRLEITELSDHEADEVGHRSGSSSNINRSRRKKYKGQGGSKNNIFDMPSGLY